MDINLLPWRENKKQESNKSILRYGFILIVLIFFISMAVRHILFLELEDIKKHKNILSDRFLASQSDISKRTKTVWIVDFLSNLPLVVQDGVYISKILIYENLITLNVSVSEINKLERLIKKIKKQGNIRKTSINGSATHSSAGSESQESRFVITFYLDGSEKMPA